MLTTLKHFLEKKYEGHNFNWRESGSKRVIGLCPEHPDKNPSFNIFIYNDKAYYKCFSCGFHGGLYDFIDVDPEQKEKYALNKENQKRLSESFAKMKDYLLNGDTVEAVFARKYLKEKRFLDMSVVKDVGLIRTTVGGDSGIDDILSGGNKIKNYSGWLVFPHTNIKGDICRLKFREPDTKNIKTANIKGFEGEPAAFGLKNVGGRESSDYPVSPYIYITEGEFNYLQYINISGIGNIISAGGKDNISFKLINALLSLDFIPVIALDQDDAGKKQLRKIYEQTPAGYREKIVYCEYGGDGKKDFDDIFKNKSEDGVNSVLAAIKYKILDKFQEFIDEENLNKEIKIEEFIDNNVLGEGLKEIYLNKYKITPNKSFKKMNILAVVNGPERIIDFILPGLPRKSVGLLISPGGTGKSMLALSIGGVISSGHDDIGFSTISPVKTGKVSLFLGEDPDEIDELRIQEFWTTIPPEKRQLIAENMQIFPCLGDTGDLLDGGTTGDRIISAAGNSRLIIIDTLSRFHLGEENERKDAARVMRELERIALTTSAAVLILHHISKAAVLMGQGDKAEAARGSNVFVNESRWVAFLKGMGIKEASDFGIDKNFHSDYVRLGCSKLNYSKFFVDIWLKRGNGGILAAADDLNNKNKEINKDENDKEKNYKKEYEDIPENWA